MIPESHHGDWAGPCRLWHPDPVTPQRSEATMAAEGRLLTYRWTVDGADHDGVLELAGPPSAVQARWTDGWHMPTGTVCHGQWDRGVLRLWTTYGAGDDTWGWPMELDTTDPETLTLRMWNVHPSDRVDIAFDIIGHHAQ